MKLFFSLLVGLIEAVTVVACGVSALYVIHWGLTKVERRTPIDRRDHVSEAWLTDQEQGRRW